MKKTFRFKVCAGFLGVSALTLSISNMAFAAASYIKVGNEDLYSTSKKSNTAGTATYIQSIRTLSLNKYSGSDIITNVPNLKVVCADTNKEAMTTSATAATTPVTIPASICKSADETVKNPETLDPIYYYLAIFVASSAILAARRRFAKH